MSRYSIVYHHRACFVWLRCCLHAVALTEFVSIVSQVIKAIQKEIKLLKYHFMFPQRDFVTEHRSRGDVSYTLQTDAPVEV